MHSAVRSVFVYNHRKITKNKSRKKGRSISEELNNSSFKPYKISKQFFSSFDKLKKLGVIGTGLNFQIQINLQSLKLLKID